MGVAILVTGLTAIIVISIIVTLLSARAIVPLSQLAAAVDQIAAQKADVQIPALNRKDEI